MSDPRFQQAPVGAQLPVNCAPQPLSPVQTARLPERSAQSPFPEASSAINRTTATQAEATSNGVDRQGKTVTGSIHVYDGTNLNGRTRHFNVSYHEEKGELVPQLTELNDGKPVKSSARVLFYADGSLYSAKGELIGAFGLNNRAGKELKDSAIVPVYGTLERPGGGTTGYDPNTLQLDGVATVIVNAPPPNSVKTYQSFRELLTVDNSTQTGHVSMELPGQRYRALWTRAAAGGEAKPGVLTAEGIEKAISEKRAATTGERRWHLSDGTLVEKTASGYAVIRDTVIPTDGVTWQSRLAYGTGRTDREYLNFAPKPVVPAAPMEAKQPAETPSAKGEPAVKAGREQAPLPRPSAILPQAPGVVDPFKPQPAEMTPRPRVVPDPSPVKPPAAPEREIAPLPRQSTPLPAKPEAREVAPLPRTPTPVPQAPEKTPEARLPEVKSVPEVAQEMGTAERRHAVRLVQLAVAKMVAAEDDYVAARDGTPKASLDVARTGKWDVSTGRAMAETLKLNVVHELEQLDKSIAERKFKPTEETKALLHLIKKVQEAATKRIADLDHDRPTGLCREMRGAGIEAAAPLQAYLREDKQVREFSQSNFSEFAPMKITESEVNELVAKGWLGVPSASSLADNVRAIDHRAQSIADCLKLVMVRDPELRKGTLDKGVAAFLGNRTEPLTIGETERLASHLRGQLKFDSAVVNGPGEIQVAKGDQIRFRKIVEEFAALAKAGEFNNQKHDSALDSGSSQFASATFDTGDRRVHRQIWATFSFRNDTGALTLSHQSESTGRYPIRSKPVELLKIEAK